jgi:hypothetical protein
MDNARTEKANIMLDATLKYVPTSNIAEIRALEVHVEILGEENMELKAKNQQLVEEFFAIKVIAEDSNERYLKAHN